MPTPRYDKTIDAAVKAEEERTGEKAPYFGADSQPEALELKAWKRIGKAWGKTPITCWMAYVAHYGNPRRAVPFKDLYTKAAIAAVRSGERDAEVKRAAAVCHDAGREVWNYAHQYMREAGQTEVRTRLKALDYKSNKAAWLADLHAELDAAEKELVGQQITYDVDRSTHKVVAVGFVNTSTEIHAFCVADKKSAEFKRGDEWECSVAHARIWAAGGVVPEPEEESEDEEELPAVPDPPKPPKAPKTRAELKRAAKSAAQSAAARQTNKKARKKAAADKAAAKAEAKKDVVRTDASYRGWRPPLDSVAGDARALAVKIPERLALLDVERLLDTRTVSTQLPHRRIINPYSRTLAPAEGTPAERLDVLQRIAGVRVKIEDDLDGSKLRRVAGFYQAQIRDAVGASRVRLRGQNEVTVYLAPDVPANLRRNGAEGVWCMGANDGTLSDQGCAMLAYVKNEADAAPPGELKDALIWWTGCLERWGAARCVLAEFAFYLPGIEGNIHDDKETPDLKNKNCHLHRGGLPKGAIKCGSVSLRVAHTVLGRRPMSIHDIDGHLVTIPRGPGRGVLFVDGAHTEERGIVKHRNDAGAEAGATLIVTFRRHVSSAFADLSEAERLFVQTGIALFH